MTRLQRRTAHSRVSSGCHLACLENDIDDPTAAVEIPENVQSEARLALERMLAMP